MNNCKKYLSLIFSLCLFSTILIFGGTSQAGAAVNEPVKMYNTQNVNRYHGSTSLKVFVQVQNLGYDKSVSLHYKLSTSDTWEDANGSYVATLQDGTEIWEVDLGGFFGEIEYAVKYEVNGQTYWDNNNQNNYTLEDKIGVAALRVNKSTPFSTGSEYNISVNLKNLGYNKDVKVRYTEDNWNTWKEKSLSYFYTLGDGTEQWSTSLNLGLNYDTINQFEYAVSYTVNGVTYWESNFGRNFDSRYSSDY